MYLNQIKSQVKMDQNSSSFTRESNGERRERLLTLDRGKNELLLLLLLLPISQMSEAVRQAMSRL